MLNSVFTSLFDNDVSSITLPGFLICIGTALVLGFAMALTYMYRRQYTRSFVVTLATLPAAVSVVIMMVSGSLGAGIAVAGTFSLVRFRSVAGTAREIGAVFLAMAAGLACGMGCPAFGILFTIIMCLVNLLYDWIGFGVQKKNELERQMQITVPEDINYMDAFNDLFERYASEIKLIKVRTTNLGSLNRLTYRLTLKSAGSEKAFMDELRCRNGNLEISIGLPESTLPEL